MWQWLGYNWRHCRLYGQETTSKDPQRMQLFISRVSANLVFNAKKTAREGWCVTYVGLEVFWKDWEFQVLEDDKVVVDDGAINISRNAALALCRIDMK